MLEVKINVTKAIDKYYPNGRNVCEMYESSRWLKKTLSEVKRVICIGMFRNRAISKLQKASQKKKNIHQRSIGFKHLRRNTMDLLSSICLKLLTLVFSIFFLTDSMHLK